VRVCKSGVVVPLGPRRGAVPTRLLAARPENRMRCNAFCPLWTAPGAVQPRQQGDRVRVCAS